MSTVFITGPTGCIGAATISSLLADGVDRVVGFSRTEDWSRIDEQCRPRVRLITGDITDAGQVREAVLESRPDRIIHLAAYQTPDCQADPFGGFDVNVTGSINVFRAAAELGDSLQRFVFASSAAVYGSRSIYPADTVEASAPYQPPNLYGYWKVAGEGMAQAFHLETGVSTVSLRLATTYGPGRDRGLTSAPTTAIKSVVSGVPFRMPYQGREHYHYVSDVGAGFGQAAIDGFDGCEAFNLRGQTVEVREFLSLLTELALPDRPADVDIAADASVMPFVCDLDDHLTVQAFPRMPLTSLRSGISQSIERFQQMDLSVASTTDHAGAD